jgi:hypothetical protein
MRMYPRSQFPIAVLVLAVLVGACSGSSRTTGQSGPSEPTPADETSASVAEYETFDPSAYAVTMPERSVIVSHQVPLRLLQGRADEGVRRAIDGFRIQVFSARDKQAAQDFRERVRQWWEEETAEVEGAAFGADPPIVIKYSQPYYRVRIGAFADREAAEQALSVVSQEYPNAFISRGTVTVTR